MNAHARMAQILIDPLLARGKPLTNKILERAVGGEVVMRFYTTKDRLTGKIESASLAAGTVEVTCDCVYYQKSGTGKKKPDERRDGFIIVTLKSGWDHRHDGLEIYGEEGVMTINFPA